ncbi:unnamed protein product [Caenorhabditis nigoni]
MIRIPGQPIFSTPYATLDVSWEKCIEKCRADINCSAVYKNYDNQCEYYPFGSLTSFYQVDFQGEIALKIQLPGDQCPTSNPLLPGPNNFTQVINGQHYTTTVSKDAYFKYMYNLNYSIAVPVQTCPNNTKQFPRLKWGEPTVVCIGLFFFEEPLCNNFTRADTICRAKNGTLTGPANADEYKYIQNISNSSKYTSNPDSYKYLTYWIDGESTMWEKDYAVSDITHYGFTNYTWEAGAPRYKEIDYCLHNPAPHGLYIVDSPCNSTALDPYEIQLPGNNCPTSNPLIPGPTYLTQTINNQLRTTTVSFDSKSKQYNLTYSVISCPNNTKLFLRRGTTKVCIGLYFFEEPRCNNQAQASALCKAQNGTLTGPANANEYKYIQNISNSSNYTSNPDSFDYLTYWIDGAGTNTAYTFEDPTHDGTTNYQWAEGVSRSKEAGQCLHNPNPLHVNISEYPCTATFLVKAVCWRGALCQIPPIIE